jgi:hypothetical protein
MNLKSSFSRRPTYALAIIALTLILGCNKSDRDEDLETLSASDHALAHHIFDDAFRQVHRFAMADTLLNDTNVKQRLDECLDRRTTILSDTVAVFPLTLTLNYADDGIPCYDQGLRYGIIRTVFSGKYLNQGSTYSISFVGYKKDIYDVSGNITIVNMGLNSVGKRYYTFSVEDGLITGVNTNVTFDGSFEYVWTSGSSTETDFDDDVFEIVEGNSYGRNSRGSAFTNEITEALISDFSCAHFTAGRSYMEVQNLTPRTINYGEPTNCDNLLISRRFNTYIEVEIPIMPLATF